MKQTKTDKQVEIRKKYVEKDNKSGLEPKKENNKQVTIKSRERLLTEAEKECMMQIYEAPNRKRNFIFLCVVAFILIMILSGMFYLLGGMYEGIVCFLVGNAFLLFIVISTSMSTNRQLGLLKANELYVKEAVYTGSTKYGTGFFKVARGGIYSEKAMLCEPDIKSGDKVILVQKKGQVWVYKARD